MADPTLADDVAFLRQLLEATGLRSVPVALDRIEAALKDREHLEFAARRLSALLGLTVHNVTKEELVAWLERERARNQGSSVVKSTP